MAISVAVDTVADRIALVRRHSGLSAAEFGRRAGLSRATISSIESGRNEEPETDTVRKIAKLSGASLAWLLDGEGKPPSAKSVREAASAKAA